MLKSEANFHIKRPNWKHLEDLGSWYSAKWEQKWVSWDCLQRFLKFWFFDPKWTLKVQILAKITKNCQNYQFWLPYLTKISKFQKLPHHIFKTSPKVLCKVYAEKLTFFVFWPFCRGSKSNFCHLCIFSSKTTKNEHFLKTCHLWEATISRDEMIIEFCKKYLKGKIL